MRVSTRDTLVNWSGGKGRYSNRRPAIWTNGEDIFSYDTMLVWRDRESGQVVLNATRYSQTTTRHQNGIRAYLAEWLGTAPVEVNGLPFGWQNSPNWRSLAADAIARAGGVK